MVKTGATRCGASECSGCHAQPPELSAVRTICSTSKTTVPYQCDGSTWRYCGSIHAFFTPLRGPERLAGCRVHIGLSFLKKDARQGSERVVSSASMVAVCIVQFLMWIEQLDIVFRVWIFGVPTYHNSTRYFQYQQPQQTISSRWQFPP